MPEIRKLFMREQSEVRIGQGFAEALQRGGGHNRVAEPIDAAHEDAARLADGSWRMDWHGNARNWLSAIFQRRASRCRRYRFHVADFGFWASRV